MKLSKIKYAIAAAILLFFTAALPFEAQGQRTPFASQEEFLPASPLRSDPCDPNFPDGNANGEINLPPPAPIKGGLWILTGLVIVYGVFRGRRHKKDMT